MINADEARNMKIPLTNEDLIVLNNIERRIIEAISSGDTKCYCLDLPLRVKTELKTLGYEVEPFSDNLYKVSW